MLVELDKSWLPPSVEAQIEHLTESLQGYSGYRAVWLSSDDRLWHAEPDEELEPHDFLYVGCLLRPDAEELAIAIAKVMPPHVLPAREVRPVAGLHPAMSMA